MKTDFLISLSSDRDFRKKFIDSPAEFLLDAGMTEYSGKKILVHENSNVSLNYCLLPKGSDLSILKNIDSKFIEIQEKVWADNEFREKVLANPKTTLSEFFKGIPEKMNIHFFENTDSTAHIVLPALKMDNDELDDNDLELVAGGKGNVIDTIGDVADSIENLPYTIFEKFIEITLTGAGTLISFVSPVTDPVHDFMHDKIFDPISDAKDKAERRITDPLNNATNSKTFQSIWAVGW